MADISFPNFDIDNSDDAKLMLSLAEKLKDYIQDLEEGALLPDSAEETLKDAYKWLPDAFYAIDIGRENYHDDREINDPLCEAFDILGEVLDDIPRILESNEILKEDLAREQKKGN